MILQRDSQAKKPCPRLQREQGTRKGRATRPTICIVTHDPRYAGFAERTINMLDGRVVGEIRAASVGV